MIKTLSIIAISCFIALGLSSTALHQVKKDGIDTLVFLLGEWESQSVNHESGETAEGRSIITRILKGNWMKWEFSGQTSAGQVYVLTLITYQPDRQKYAFYSFNNFDSDPLPHFGTWIEKNTLRLTINEGDQNTQVDFILRENGGFDQIHSSVSSTGEAKVRLTTRYRKIDKR